MTTPEKAGRGGHGAACAGRPAVRVVRPRGGRGGRAVRRGGGSRGGGRWGWSTPAATAGGWRPPRRCGDSGSALRRQRPRRQPWRRPRGVNGGGKGGEQSAPSAARRGGGKGVVSVGEEFVRAVVGWVGGTCGNVGAGGSSRASVGLRRV